jgi:hypothetical protein
VIESLQKDYLEYLSIEEGGIMDDNGALIYSLPKNMIFATGDRFHLLDILPEGLA